MNSFFACLFCGEPLAETNFSKEHIIPNAIGGQLHTKSATCVKCNSKAGDSIDGHLTKKLSLLANAFDVPRNRGQHPDVNIVDDISGLEYKLASGGNPVIDINFKAKKENGEIQANFFAQNLKEAERILKKKKFLKQNVNIYKLTGEERSREKFSFTLSPFSYKDKQILKAVAKIAVCYGRYLGLPIPHSVIAARFMRGDITNFIPVSTAFGDVVKFNELPENPLFHGVFLFKPPEQNLLFAYITLFQAYEFVVLVDEQSQVAELCSGYLWNVISGNSESHEFEWVASPSEILKWFERDDFSGERMLSRAEPLKFWLNNRDNLWMNRALSAASKRFFQRIDEGVTIAEANLEAQEVAQKVLLKYGISLEKFQFSLM